MIRVLLAEDQAMVRGALAVLLRLEADIAIVAQVARGDEIVPAALATQPDVALIDIELPGQNGLDAARELRERLPSCRVVIVTTFGRSGYLQRAIAGGAVGFLLKEAPAAALADALGWKQRDWPSRRAGCSVGNARLIHCPSKKRAKDGPVPCRIVRQYLGALLHAVLQLLSVQHVQCG
jgi:CheY-like chemotaxis protein